MSRPSHLHASLLLLHRSVLINRFTDMSFPSTNCALDGAAYESTYGITSSGSSLKLGYVTGYV